MTNSEWIAIISVITIVIGWFLNSALNRRNEIAKKRLEFRLNILNLMFNTFVEVYRSITLNNINDEEKLFADLTKALGCLVYYGDEKEKKLCNTISKKISKNQPIKSEMLQLLETLSEKIKKELKFK